MLESESEALDDESSEDLAGVVDLSGRSHSGTEELFGMEEAAFKLSS